MDEILTLDQWYELQSRIKQQYPELTDADLQYHEALEPDMLLMVEYILLKQKVATKELRISHFHFSPTKPYGHFSRKSPIRQ